MAEEFLACEVKVQVRDRWRVHRLVKKSRNHVSDRVRR